MAAPHVCGAVALLLVVNTPPLDVLDQLQGMATEWQTSRMPTDTQI